MTQEARQISELNKSVTAVSEPSDSETASFEWTAEAVEIRRQLSSLAMVPEHSIDENSSMFDLGLDSIDAIKLSSRLKLAGLALSVTSIMRDLTIAKMIGNLRNVSESNDAQSQSVIIDDISNRLRLRLKDMSATDGDIEDVLPATALQEAMIASSASHQQSHYYTNELFKLASAVDVERLIDAWDHVVRSSPMLRTSFAEIDDPNIEVTYAQLVHRPKITSWQTIQLSETDQIEDIIAKAQYETSNDLLSTPPLKLTVYHRRDEHFLLLSMSHALYDGWTLQLLHHDVHAAYQGSYIPRPSYKPLLARIMQSSSSDAANFWRSQLSGIESTLFPEQRPAPGTTRVATQRREAHSRVRAAAIQGFCKTEGISLQAVGQACWAFILSHYVKKLDVVFGVVVAGREMNGAEDLLFPTMNTIAMRSIIHGTRREMLQYMSKLQSWITPFQHFPLRRAQAFVRSGSRGLFNTLFIVQKRLEGLAGTDNVLYTSVDGSSTTEV
jgi:aryl carrier-like protein